jgi:hypothetical protein
VTWIVTAFKSQTVRLLKVSLMKNAYPPSKETVTVKGTPT